MTEAAPSGPTPGHHIVIDQRQVMVFDGLLDPQDQVTLHQAVRNSSYTRSEFARPETADYRHWAVDIDLAVATRLPIQTAALRALHRFDPTRAYRLYRCYVNVSHYGDMLFSHTDCKPGAGEVTGLWYVCDKWEPDWGGETMFFDHGMDVRAAIQPRPGRFVLFDGELAHVGRPPNRICYASRFTLAMKFEPAR